MAMVRKAAGTVRRPRTPIASRKSFLDTRHSSQAAGWLRSLQSGTSERACRSGYRTAPRARATWRKERGLLRTKEVESTSCARDDVRIPALVAYDVPQKT